MVFLTGGGGLRLPGCVEPGGAGSLSARLASGRRQRGNGASAVPIHAPTRPSLAASNAVGFEARLNMRSSLELALEQAVPPVQHSGTCTGPLFTFVSGTAIQHVGSETGISRGSGCGGDGNSSSGTHSSTANGNLSTMAPTVPVGADPTDPMCLGPRPGLVSVVASHQAVHATNVASHPQKSARSSSTVGAHCCVHALGHSVTDASTGQEEQPRTGHTAKSKLSGGAGPGTAPPASGGSLGSLPAPLLALTDASLPVVLPQPGSLACGRAPGSGLVSAGTAALRLDNRELDKLVATLGRSKATWRRALVLYEWLQEAGHMLDDRLCTTLIRVCAEHGQAVAALGVYDWMRSPQNAGGGGLSPSVYTYTAAMRAALGAGLLERAMQVWEDACAARCSPDCRLAITMIEVCARRGDTERALSMYATMRSAPSGSRLAPTVHAYTAAMRAATEGGRWRAALDVWTDLCAARCAPTAHAYSAAIAACAAGGDWQRAVALFEDMCADGIRPDVVSCTALIGALAAAGQWQRAEAVVSWMLGSGLKPNVRTYTALMTALGNAAQWDRALEVLGLMQTPGWGAVAPNAYTYSALLKALAEAGEWQLAEHVFSSLEADALAAQQAAASLQARQRPPLVTAGILEEPCRVVDVDGGPASAKRSNDSTAVAPSSWTSPAALYGLSLQLLPSDSRAISALKNTGPSPSGSVMDSHSCAGSARTSCTGNGLDVVQPLPVMQSGMQSGGPCHDAVQQTLKPLASCTVAGFADQPVELEVASGVAGGTSSSDTGGGHLGMAAALTTPALSAAAMGNPANLPCRGHAPIVNEVVCGAMMLAYDRAGRWADAVTMLSRARTLGVEPNTAMYNTAMSAATRAGQLAQAESLFAEMGPPKSPHDAVSYETLIAAYGAAADVQRAEAAYAALCAAGLRPHDYAYCGLVAAHSLAGDLASALRIRQRMARDDVAVTVHVYNALIAACERCGQYERALDCLRAMKRDGVQPNGVTAQLMATIGKKGAASVESQQLTAAALSAAMAAAGTILMRTGVF